MSIFPAAGFAATAPARALPLAREVRFDLDRCVPVFRGGVPLYVEGRDAVAVWACKALHTWRYRHPIYSPGYGNDVWQLIGQAYTEALKTSEAARYVRECLLVSPYITEVGPVTVDFDDSDLRIDATITTIYGEVTLHV